MRALVAALLIAAATVPAPAATASPPLRTLTVRGTPNAYAEVTFAGRVRFETSMMTKTPPGYDSDGGYAAVYVEPVHALSPVSGTMLLRDLPGWEDMPVPIGTWDWLPPGRYRVHLLGDAPTTVRVRVAGLRRDLTVTTRTRADVAAAWGHRGVAGVATPVDRTIVPFTVRRKTLVIIGSTHESTGFYARYDECIRKRSNGLSPCLQGNAGRGWYWGVYPFTWRMGGPGGYFPGTLPLGELEVEFFDAAVAVPHSLATFVLTLN